MSRKRLFGGSCWRNQWSYVSWGSSFLAPRYDRDDTILNTSLSLYIIFISEALWNKRGGVGIFWHCVAFLFLFYCSHSLLPSTTQLRGPGEWILEWRRVITVPYQWLTEARVPPACHCPVALSLLWPFCSTTLSRHTVVDIRSDKETSVCLSVCLLLKVYCNIFYLYVNIHSRNFSKLLISQSES